MIDDEWLRAHPLPPFHEDGDKETRGRVLVIGGSRQTAGAVILAGLAALRVGAGKLRLLSAPEALVPLALAVPEARVFPFPQPALRRLAESCQAVLLGPGLLSGRRTRELLTALLPVNAPLVLDALALRVVKRRDLQARAGPTLLTPHGGELRALGEDPGRDGAARLAEQTGAVVVCKGAETWIAAPDGRVACNRAGHVGLATSGSGDVLAGAIVGLCGRGADPFVAAAWGVHLHARAAEELGPPGFLAGELAPRFPGLLASYQSPGSSR